MALLAASFVRKTNIDKEKKEGPKKHHHHHHRGRQAKNKAVADWLEKGISKTDDDLEVIPTNRHPRKCIQIPRILGGASLVAMRKISVSHPDRLNQLDLDDSASARAEKLTNKKRVPPRKGQRSAESSPERYSATPTDDPSGFFIMEKEQSKGNAGPKSKDLQTTFAKLQSREVTKLKLGLDDPGERRRSHSEHSILDSIRKDLLIEENRRSESPKGRNPLITRMWRNVRKLKTGDRYKSEESVSQTDSTSSD